MPRKRSLLNARSVFERLVSFADDIKARKYDNQLVPAYHDKLMQMAFIAKHILRKSKEKGRKDIYIERRAI